MKPSAHFLIVAGLLLFVLALNDEQRGIASVIPPRAYTGVRYTAKKVDDPTQFHNLMTYEWIRASLLLGAGIILLTMCRSADKTDPFSPRFAGKRELDELGEELNREKEKRQRPLK